jgi:hypothetical protein
LFQSCDTDALRKLLPGCRLASSAAAAKQARSSLINCRHLIVANDGPYQMLFVFEPGSTARAEEQVQSGKNKKKGSARIKENGKSTQVQNTRVYLGVHLGMTGRM